MKKVWKWILGIVIAIVVVAALVGGFLLMRNYRMTTFAQRYRQSSQVPNGSAVPNGQTNPNGQATPTSPNRPNRPMMGRGFGYGRGPMMMGRGGYGYGPMMQRGFGFPPFFLGLSLMFGVVKLALFGLLLYGAYWLGRRSARSAVAPVAPDPEPTPQRGRKVAKG
jgi:hypothetical protein